MQTKLILIADDYDETAETLALVVEASSPHQTCVAKDGEEALGIALARRPSVMVLDIDMPKMNALDVAREIRRQLGPNRPTVIGLSGRNDLAQRAEHGLFDRVMRKPLDLAALLRLLDE